MFIVYILGIRIYSITDQFQFTNYLVVLFILGQILLHSLNGNKCHFEIRLYIFFKQMLNIFSHRKGHILSRVPSNITGWYLSLVF